MRFIHTEDVNMKNILMMAENVAPSRASIMIEGESGTGKELLARFIHAKSNRSAREFFALNCAAVPEGLLESELFGFEKGAFTGADARKLGKFECAHQSTLLLDEISELPLLLQAKILRVLQEGEIERLGGQKPIKVDVRIIAASNKDLKQMVAQGQFREDLYYRLNVIPLAIPPLRQRMRDIELLARLFADISAKENGLESRVLDDSAIKKLREWRWPGNVRELQNVIERSVLLTSESVITADLIKIDGFETQIREKSLQPGMTVQEAERLLIMKTLEYTDQNRTQAAHLLGISIRTLRNKLNEYREDQNEQSI
jgi:transcriptional regulator with PAS, ATPase and Fis domain